MSGRQHVAVVMGGISDEREISLGSGRTVCAALESTSYEVTPIDAGYDLALRLAEVKPDLIFNALHGVWGEDGKVQGLFESMRIPYTHSGVLASALAMDKVKAKIIFAEAGLPLARHLLVPRWVAAESHVMEPPYVVKPVNQGSSLGVFIVEEGANHPPSQLGAFDWPYGEEVMVEEYIGGLELSCAILGDRALGIVELIPKAGYFYDYRQKYDSDGALHEVPARINESLTERINKLALTAHKKLGCRGATRVDFRYDKKTNQLVVLEVNTQPGMMKQSLVPEIADHVGMDMIGLVCWLLEDASCER